MKIKHLFLLLAVIIISSGCVNKGNVKDNFCGIHINAQYCKCAFHNEQCEFINMSKGEAKNYVYGKYDDWKNGDPEKFKTDCKKKAVVFTAL